MMSSVAEIEALDRAALIAAWAQVFGTPVPKRLSSPFLHRFLVFELQARQNGGLHKGFVAKLKKAASDDAGASSPALKPGGRLIREWNGVTHVVDVADDGNVWNGQPHSVRAALSGLRKAGYAVERQDPKKPGGEAIYRITGAPGEA